MSKIPSSLPSQAARFLEAASGYGDVGRSSPRLHNIDWGRGVLSTLLLAVVFSASATGFDGELRGRYVCGANSSSGARASQPFSVPLELTVSGSTVSGTRETHDTIELFSGKVSESASITVQMNGNWNDEPQRAWTGTFAGTLAHDSVVLAGAMYAANGTTRIRDCTLTLVHTASAVTMPQPATVAVNATEQSGETVLAKRDPKHTSNASSEQDGAAWGATKDESGVTASTGIAATQPVTTRLDSSALAERVEPEHSAYQPQSKPDAKGDVSPSELQVTPSSAPTSPVSPPVSTVAIWVDSVGNTLSTYIHKSEAFLGNFWPLFIFAWVATVAVGVVSGWRERLVVFRNYDDLALVFFAIVSLWAAFLVTIALTGWLRPVALVLAACTFVGCSLVMMVRTWIDNPSPMWFLVALATKLTFAILFVANLIGLMWPGGRTNLQRAQSRASAVAWLAILAPVVLRLVRDHTGVWAPRDVLNQYQRGRLRV